MPTRNLVVVMVAAAISVACYAKAEHNRYVAILGEALGLIEHNALEAVDARTLFDGAMEGMVASLGDQYSNYIPPKDFGGFQEGLDQEFGGVGIMVEMHPTTKLLTVLSPLVNTPAYEAGIQAGDVIVAIDGKPTREMAMTDAVAMMRGKPGAPVTLKIRRGDDQPPREFRLRRAIIHTESVLGDTRRPDGAWNFYLEDNPRLGYIRISTFGERTVHELEQALATYEKHPIDALILDLRDNAGGYLSAAIDVANAFIDRGRIVSTRGRDGLVRTSYDAVPSKLRFPKDKPVVVLVNTYTASASEIVAACLQDHGRAAVVGVRSWGKGTVQNVIQLEGGKSALKLTTASYWRPSGKNIHRGKDVGEDGDWGVTPDDGLIVALDDKTIEKLYQLRRQRDVVLRPGQQPSPPDAPLAADEASPAPANPDGSASEQKVAPPAESESTQAAAVLVWSDDPQLRRAIAHLQEKLETKEVAIRTD